MAEADQQTTRAVTREYKRQRLEHDTGLELYFAREPLPPYEPVRVFQHTMKTGGTSLRALIYYNVSRVAEYEPREIAKISRDLHGLYADVYGRLTPEQRARLTWAISHHAAYLIPHVERPVRGLTIAREPVDRALSRYWFAVSNPQLRTLETLRTLFEHGGVVDSKIQRYEYVNPQSRWLLGPHFDLTQLSATAGPPHDGDLWLERLTRLLDETYEFVFVQGRLNEAMVDLARRWGWAAATPIFRRSGARPAVDDLDDELRELISAYNWLDVELYRYALARADRAPEEIA